MAVRKRTIQPNIWQDENFGLLKNPLAQLIYIGCITQADDDGRMIGHPAVIKSSLFPYGFITLEQVFDALDELIAKMKNFIYYEVDKNYYIQLKNWDKHQKQQGDRRQKSLFPAPPKELAPNNMVKTLDNLRKNLETQDIIKKTKLI